MDLILENVCILFIYSEFYEQKVERDYCVLFVSKYTAFFGDVAVDVVVVVV